MIEVRAEFPIVIAFDPCQVVGKLHAAFIGGVERPKVVAKQESIWNV
jgi:hypothetical protein